MDDFERHLAAAMKAASSVPPSDIDPDEILRAPSRSRVASQWLSIAAAVVVAAAAVTMAVVLWRNHDHRNGAEVSATRGARSSVTRPYVPPVALPSIPRQSSAVWNTSVGAFTSNEYRMTAAQFFPETGPYVPRHALCSLHQITALATTRRTVGGVLGVIHFRGAVLERRHGRVVRCTLPIDVSGPGPSALLAADGSGLAVPLSAGDTRLPPANGRPDIAIDDGYSSWGFAWFGSFCGARAAAVEFPLSGKAGSLRVPLRGPQPRCGTASAGSSLIAGVPGTPGEPVQSPRPDYADLRLTGRVRMGTTPERLAPVDLTLRTVGSRGIVLDPCPALGTSYDGHGPHGRFGGSGSSSYFDCASHSALVAPGRPVHVTVPAMRLRGSYARAGKGSTMRYAVSVAGVGVLRLSTKVE